VSKTCIGSMSLNGCLRSGVCRVAQTLKTLPEYFALILTLRKHVLSASWLWQVSEFDIREKMQNTSV
jgi:hypothetical protein